MAIELFEGCSLCSQKELEELTRVKDEFNLKGKIVSVIRKKEGRINGTLAITTSTETDGFERHIFQTINVDVFKHPVELMNNINLVTSHIRDKGMMTLYVHPVKTKTSESPFIYFDKETGKFWRVYNYIESTVKNSVESSSDMYILGKELGKFSSLLDDFDVSLLTEPIPGFHDTRKRYSAFVAIMTNDLSCFGRVRSLTCMKEIEFILQRSEKVSLIMDALKFKMIPFRVSHNDPKLNNVLFDPSTGEVICLVDLDTVGPGSVLYDFGDAARFACNTESEEAVSVENVSFDVERFTDLTRGLLESMKDTITDKEVELLVDSVWMMTFELVLRFLTDHIDGNHYFGVEYDGKNLERARVQLALLTDIEAKYDRLQKIVQEIWNEVKKG